MERLFIGGLIFDGIIIVIYIVCGILDTLDHKKMIKKCEAEYERMVNEWLEQVKNDEG